jgi:SET domain-containing protein
MNQPDDVAVRVSTIEALGLFACRAFKAREVVHRVNVVREITADSPLREELGERFDHCDYPDGKVVLIGYPSRHLNHSCDPNAYLRYEADACHIVARRHVAADEEITIDYNVNISGGSAWPCHCGSRRCLGTVVGDFFLLPAEMQAEYRPLLAEWFVRRHAERLARRSAVETLVSPSRRPSP